MTDLSHITKPATTPAQRKAMASPMRLELLGLFTSGEPLSISDMAALVCRPSSSLYYHVDMLENLGFLRRTGTRRKGKRFETLFELTAAAFEVEVEDGDPEAVEHAVKAISSAFRMAERDLDAALRSDEVIKEGPERNVIAARVHLRASPELLRQVNHHLDAIVELLVAEQAKQPDPTDRGQHLSLTFALLPLRGRTIKKGDPS